MRKSGWDCDRNHFLYPGLEVPDWSAWQPAKQQPVYMTVINWIFGKISFWVAAILVVMEHLVVMFSLLLSNE